MLQVICPREDAGVAGTTMQEIIKALEKRGLGVPQACIKSCRAALAYQHE